MLYGISLFAFSFNHIMTRFRIYQNKSNLKIVLHHGIENFISVDLGKKKPFIQFGLMIAI